jgi:hypothetical protein
MFRMQHIVARCDRAREGTGQLALLADPAPVAASLMRRLHAAGDPDARCRLWASHGVPAGDDLGYLCGMSRLVNCYRGHLNGVEYLVGNCCDRGYIDSAFCALALGGSDVGEFLVVPRESQRQRGTPTGYPELDGSFLVRTGTEVGRPDFFGPRFAAFIVTRTDWAFGTHRGMLVCVTLEPLRTGEDARRLIDDTARAASMLGL